MAKLQTHIRVPRHCGTRRIQDALNEVATIAWRNSGNEGNRPTLGEAVIEAVGLYIRTNGGQAILIDDEIKRRGTDDWRGAYDMAVKANQRLTQQLNAADRQLKRLQAKIDRGAK